MITFSPDLSERKRILKSICRNSVQWKVRITFSVILFILAFGIVVGSLILVINHNTTAFSVFIFLAVGICFACVPFFSAISIKTSAKYKCALPYSSYANGFLILNDDNLEYVFWKVSSDEPAAYSSKRAVYKDDDKYIYSIKKSDIRSVEIINDICDIKGNGTVHLPIWLEEDATAKKDNESFSFILAFKQKNSEQIITSWRNHNE